MNKVELVAQMAEVSGLTKKDSELALDTFIDVVKTELANGGDVRLVGFATFETVERDARISRNPSNGEKIEVPACTVPKVKVSKAWKDSFK